MTEAHEGPADHGTSELLEVAYRFGMAVMALATGDAPPRQRLLAAWADLGQVEGARSGLWPEPHLAPDLAVQVHDLLDQLTAAGTVEETVAAMDDRTVTRTCRQVTSLALALHQAVAGSP